MKTEKQLLRLLEEMGPVIPAAEIASIRDFVSHGEPRFALERLCTLIYEYDVMLDPAHYLNIINIGTALSMTEDTWKFLEHYLRQERAQ